MSKNLDSETRTALYDKLIATHAEVKRKGANMPYTSLNGNMYSFISKEGPAALRLPADEREKFIKKYKTRITVSYGAVMKEYVTVPDALLKKTAELKPYLAMSLAYAKTLKAKPTTRKKSTSKKKTTKAAPKGKTTGKKATPKKKSAAKTKKTTAKKKTARKSR